MKPYREMTPEEKHRQNMVALVGLIALILLVGLLIALVFLDPYAFTRGITQTVLIAGVGAFVGVITISLVWWGVARLLQRRKSDGGR